jgi:hypothetical protein
MIGLSLGPSSQAANRSASVSPSMTSEQNAFCYFENYLLIKGQGHDFKTDLTWYGLRQLLVKMVHQLSIIYLTLLSILY